jgi:SNF2 family DNA or RNA helicase
MTVELNDALLAKLAGWEAMKQARDFVATGAVLRSEWQPPRLHGLVREGNSSYPAGLLIRSATDADNACPCRTSRQRGLICAHSVAVGLHYLASIRPATPPAAPNPKPLPPRSTARPSDRPSLPSNDRPAPPRLRRVSPGDPGEPLELFFILPPNFADAIARGQIMLFLEGQWRNGRGPLNTLLNLARFAPNPQDAALLDAFEQLNDGATPTMLRLDTAQFLEILPKLKDHPRVTLGKTHVIEVTADPWRPKVKAGLEPTGEIRLRLGDSKPPGTVFGNPAWLFDGSSLRPVDLPPQLQSLIHQPLHLPRADVPGFLMGSWQQLVDHNRLEADFAAEAFTFEPMTPRFTLHLAGHLTSLEAKLDCFYGTRSATAFPADAPWFPDPQSPTRYLARDVDAEQAALARLLRAGFSGPDPRGLFQLRGQNPVLNFFARDYPRLEREWQVTLEERLERTTEKHLDRLEPRFQITPSGEQWFDLHIDYQTRGGDRLSTSDIQQLLRGRQSHARLRNGKSLLLDSGAVEELQQVLLDCAPQQQSGSYRLNNVQAGFLDATLRRQADWQVQASPAWQKRVAQQRGEIHLDPPPLGPLESVLRPYQKTGVAWLRFLREHGFGGILADDMGLGKTLQVLAHLTALRHSPTEPNQPGPGDPPLPSLVVCPTSLVFNWAAESAKFTPALRVLVLHGSARHAQFPELDQHDLIVTSYALLRRDSDLYRAHQFDTVILDEAQHIKNRQTQNAQAVKSIRARHRLVLTGTPLENSVLDLWSIFDFLMPGYLGAATDFRERYELPIARDRSRVVQDRLARRLQPFLLRRLKRDVAADLPAKIQQVSTCELTEDQRAIYQQILEAGRRELFDTAGAGNQPPAKNRMLVLTTLLRLRQVCCDPRLLHLESTPAQPNHADTASPVTSGKIELFNELLEEILDGGHRVLVFSQFTQMLALIRDDLTARNIAFCYLDGATRDRAQVVDQFQRDPAIPVFLISLKAGGVGLNLTGADTVIHFDPWWNPAVESQATDRAHRIGQRNVVTSYKLITRGTVEEKILNLQARKRDLVQGLLGDEEQLTAALNWEEIQDLLSD